MHGEGLREVALPLGDGLNYCHLEPNVFEQKDNSGGLEPEVPEEMAAP